MKSILLLALLPTLAHAAPKPLFNGKDLTGWEGNPDLWSVQDGVITGKTTAEKPATGNTFLIWKGGDVADFELTFNYKMKPGDAKGFVNSGLQFRSKIVDPMNFVVSGYQADLEYGTTYSGILYEEKGRGILAQRGQKTAIKEVEVEKDGNKKKEMKIAVTGELGKSADIQAEIKNEDWNDYIIIARGNHLQHFINGIQTIDVTDEQESKAAKSGVLALQIHTGPPMTVQFKHLRMKTLK